MLGTLLDGVMLESLTLDKAIASTILDHPVLDGVVNHPMLEVVRENWNFHDAFLQLPVHPKEGEAVDMSQGVTEVINVDGLPQGNPNAFADKLCTVALCSSFLIMIAPLKFFYMMVRTSGDNIAQSKDQLMLLMPYLLLWVQGVYWAVWAYLDSRPELMHLQQTGVAFNTLYCGCFVFFVSDNQKWTLRFTVLGAVIAVVLTSWRGLAVVDHDKRDNCFAFAYAALTVNILLYFVPFVQLIDVVKTGVIEVFPVPLCAASLLSSVLWSWHSWLNWSLPFFLGAFIGALVNGVQVGTVLVVYLTYGRDVAKASERAPEQNEAAAFVGSSVPFLSSKAYDLNQARRLYKAGQRSDSGSGGAWSSSTSTDEKIESTRTKIHSRKKTSSPKYRKVDKRMVVDIKEDEVTRALSGFRDEHRTKEGNENSSAAESCDSSAVDKGRVLGSVNYGSTSSTSGISSSSAYRVYDRHPPGVKLTSAFSSSSSSSRNSLLGGLNAGRRSPLSEAHAHERDFEVETESDSQLIVRKPHDSGTPSHRRYGNTDNQELRPVQDQEDSSDSEVDDIPHLYNVRRNRSNSPNGPSLKGGSRAMPM